MGNKDKKTHSIYLIDLDKVKEKLDINSERCELSKVVEEITSYILV